MNRSNCFLLGSSALAMTCLTAIPASAWGPHPEVDAAHAHLVQVIEEMNTIERVNPPGSFGGHMGQASKLARQALEEFDHGVADRSRLP
jgi:hypothetical protein